MNRKCATALSLAASIAPAMVFLAQPAVAGPSSFQQSCSEISIRVVGGRATISASCAKADGQKIPASLWVRYVTNTNGVLTLNPQDRDGSFAKTCTAVSLDPATATLSARCKDMRGSYKAATSVVLENIGNFNGVLKYAQ